MSTSKIKNKRDKVKGNSQRKGDLPLPSEPQRDSRCTASPHSVESFVKRGLRIQRAVDEAIARAPACGTPPVCICIGCGCDDLHACSHEDGTPCAWVKRHPATGLGICSRCMPSDAMAIFRIGHAMGRLVRHLESRDPLAGRAAVEIHQADRTDVPSGCVRSDAK